MSPKKAAKSKVKVEQISSIADLKLDAPADERVEKVSGDSVEKSGVKSFRMAQLMANKVNILLVAGLLIVLAVGGWFGWQWFNKVPTDLPIEEVELSFDPEGPYAILEPRRDGNALILNIRRVGGYEKLTYELAYQSDASADEGEGKIDRGVTGTINANTVGKSEYSQEILFGTCSKGDTFSTLHCVFDKNVEYGTLTLKIQKKAQRGDKTIKVYKIITTWHIQKPDVALGKLVSGDNHFTYTTTADRTELASVAWTLINDLSGAPKFPDNYQVQGKVYTLNVPTAKTFPAGEVVIELAEAVSDAKIARYNESANAWDMLETQVEGSKLKTNAPAGGIFAVLTPNK